MSICTTISTPITAAGVAEEWGGEFKVSKVDGYPPQGTYEWPDHVHPTEFTKQYRLAVEGIGPMAADWFDKPHRLVFDLCKYIEDNEVVSIK